MKELARQVRNVLDSLDRKARAKIEELDRPVLSVSNTRFEQAEDGGVRVSVHLIHEPAALGDDIEDLDSTEVSLLIDLRGDTLR